MHQARTGRSLYPRRFPQMWTPPGIVGLNRQNVVSSRRPPGPATPNQKAGCVFVRSLVYDTMKRKQRTEALAVFLPQQAHGI